jgi:hypothetical protein
MPRPADLSGTDRAASQVTRQPHHVVARRVDGIFIANYEQGKIGPDSFRVACTMGLVSRHRTDVPLWVSLAHPV